MGQSADELRRDIEYTREDLGETLEAIGDRISPARMIERRKNRVMYGIRNARERVMGTAADTGRTIGDTAGGAVETLTRAPETVREQTQGSPLVAGAIAFGVGVLAAAIVKPSEVEREAADQLLDKVEPLKDELKQSGHQMAEHMKEPVREAVGQVKQAAVESTQAVTDVAKDATESSKETARQAADTVRSEASDGESNERY